MLRTASVVVIILLAGCGTKPPPTGIPMPVQVPVSTEASVSAPTGTMAQGYMGEIRMLTTDLSIARNEKPELPVFLTSYTADYFEVQEPLCRLANGQPIDARIDPQSKLVIPGDRIQFSLAGGSSPQECVGTLKVTLHTGNNTEVLSVPITVTVR